MSWVMVWQDRSMGTGLLLLCFIGSSIAVNQVNQDRNRPEFNDHAKLNPLAIASKDQIQNNGQIQNRNPGVSIMGPQIPVVHHWKKKILAKREAKKPKNTKRRKKFNKKEYEAHKLQAENARSDHIPEQYISTNPENSKPMPELDKDTNSDSSDSTDSDDSDSDSSDEGDDSDYDDDDDDDDSDEGSEYKESGDDSEYKESDYKSDTTEEIALSSEEKASSSHETQEIYSGPDSSPPASSDSTDESSASRALSGGSSEMSYTMSSSAEDAFPTMTSSSEENSGTSSGNNSTATKTDGLGKHSTSANETKTNAKLKKTGRVNDLTAKLGNKAFNKLKHIRHATVHRLKLAKLKTGKHINIKSDNKVAYMNTNSRMYLHAPTNNFIQVAKEASVGHQTINTKESERPKMEMMKPMKVKPAKDINKKEDLQHDLLKDYPENGTVEIVNWEGTFAPIVGEPYVAPLHHQPDSFWDAIYRPGDPDLPTPPGAEHEQQSTPFPDLDARKNTHSEFSRFSQSHANTIVQAEMAKSKDKGQKETKKKAKLTIKEKKQKKREKKEEKESGMDFIKLSGVPVLDNIQEEVHMPARVPVSPLQVSQSHVGTIVQAMMGKSKDKGQKETKKKAKLTIKEKKQKKKEKKEEKESGMDYIKLAGVPITDSIQNEIHMPARVPVAPLQVSGLLNMLMPLVTKQCHEEQRWRFQAKYQLT